MVSCHSKFEVQIGYQLSKFIRDAGAESAVRSAGDVDVVAHISRVM